MGLVNWDRTRGEWFFDILGYVWSLGSIVVAAYFAFITGFMAVLMTGAFVGLTVNFVTNWAVLLLREDKDAEGLEQFAEEDIGYVGLAVLIQMGTLLIAGGYALVTGSALATGIAGAMLLAYIVGLLFKGIRRATGVDQPDPTEDRDLEDADEDSEWRFDVDEVSDEQAEA